jgi:dTDP-4-dehydrorhamnose reductase
MSQTKVIVLGGSGMLGSMVVDVLSRDSLLKVSATVRSRDLLPQLQAKLPTADWKILDAERSDEGATAAVLADAQWAVNAIGVIKPYIHDDNAAEVERALRVNSIFPHLLARAGETKGCRVLQIATDCVYSGKKGQYVETDSHDALDVYGKSKSLGEVTSKWVYHLRCSIIGPEPKAHVSLLDWFLKQASGGKVKGFTNHQWNGVTTFHYARLCRGIITQNHSLPNLQHLIPGDSISKAELLESFAQAFRRQDMVIDPTEAQTVIDRTLATQQAGANQKIWRAAGYTTPPSVRQMVDELAQFDYSLK